MAELQHKLNAQIKIHITKKTRQTLLHGKSHRSQLADGNLWYV